jgi:hypothetical protein
LTRLLPACRSTSTARAIVCRGRSRPARVEAGTAPFLRRRSAWEAKVYVLSCEVPYGAPSPQGRGLPYGRPRHQLARGAREAWPDTGTGRAEVRGACHRGQPDRGRQTRSASLDSAPARCRGQGEAGAAPRLSGSAAGAACGPEKQTRMGAVGDLALDHRPVQGLHRIRQIVLGVASLPGDRPGRPIAEWESRRTPTSTVGGRPPPADLAVPGGSRSHVGHQLAVARDPTCAGVAVGRVFSCIGGRVRVRSSRLRSTACRCGIPRAAFVATTR